MNDVNERERRHAGPFVRARSSFAFVRLVVAVLAVALSSLLAAAQRGSITPPQITPVGQAPQGRGRGNTVPPKPLVTTGVIVGTVIDAASGRPVAGAVVTLNGGPSRIAPPAGARGTPAPQPPRVLSDADGRFAFLNLTRGNYSLGAAKVGYAPGAYGRSRPDGATRPLQLDDGERVGDATIRIFKYAAITGRIVDEAGEPVVGADVRAYRRVLVSGRRRFAETSSVQTDDRGIYRVYNLAPGDYVVCVPMMSVTNPTPAPARFALQSATLAPPATDGSSQPRGYARQYYPLTQSIAAAELLTLASGEERAGVDVAVRYVPVVNISGTVIGPDGPAARLAVRLIASDATNIVNEPESAWSMTDAAGAFMFIGVPSGQYTIKTVRLPTNEAVYFTQIPPGSTPMQTKPPTPLQWASAAVSVGDADLAGVSLTMEDGLSISGRFEFEGSRPRPGPQALAQIPIVVEPADGRDNTPGFGPPPSRATSDGRFVTGPRLPGKYYLRAGGAPAGYSLKSIIVNGVDATDGPFDLSANISNAVITFTNLTTQVRGTVRNDTAGADPPAIVLFPADSTAWMDFGLNPLRMKMTRASPAGTFAFGTLIPGDYFVAAIRDEFSNEWQDPAFLTLLERSAERVTLTAGQRLTLNQLTISTVKPPGISRRPPPLTGEPSAMTQDRPAAAQLHGPFVEDQALPPSQVRDVGRPEPTGSGSIAGVVMQDDGSTRPARVARVQVRGGGLQSPREALTNDEGQFIVSGLPSGDYIVVVNKPSYLSMYYGSQRPTIGPGTPVHVGDGQAVTGINVTLSKGAVIAGVVTDAMGQPSPSVRIQVLMYVWRDGQRVLAGAAATGSSSTNDRGEYRFYGLRPGAYLVSAIPSQALNQDIRQLSDAEMRTALAATGHSPAPAAPASIDAARILAPALPNDAPDTTPAGRPVAFSPVFYPGTPREDDAGQITVTAGEERNGVNIPLQLVPTSRLEGRVIGTDGQTVTNAQVILTRTLGPVGANSSVRQQDGGFQVMSVPMGHYVLSALLEQSPPREPSGPVNQPSAPTISWARQELEVEADQLNLVLALAPSLSLRGRVVFDGSPPPDLRSIQVNLDLPGGPQGPLARRPRSGTPDATGAFTLDGVLPNRYRVSASAAMRDWSVLSATVGGRDALTELFEVTADRPIGDVVVTFTNHPAEISGKLIDGAGQPVRGMVVVLFPADRAKWPAHSSWLNRTTQPGADGTFRFTVLPGDYYLAVLTELDNQQWPDPEFKDLLVPSSIKVSVTKGEKKTQDMRILR